jgi:hypothetical protein
VQRLDSNPFFHFMSATSPKTGLFLVQSRPADGESTQSTAVDDFPACMSQIAALLCSGRKVFSIQYDAKPIGRPVLDAMIRLAARRETLDALATSFALNPMEAVSWLGHLLVQDAFIVQTFLEATPAARSIDSRTPKPASAAFSLESHSFSQSPRDTDPASVPDPAIPLDKLRGGERTVEPQVGLGFDH